MKNGLYSIHVTLADGHSGKGSGVVIFRNGEMLGGDAFLFYTGCYTSDGARMKGEIIVNQHTPSPGQLPIFSGREVGIGFTGDCTDTSATMYGTALVGKTSVTFRATLRRLADAAA